MDVVCERQIYLLIEKSFISLSTFNPTVILYFHVRVQSEKHFRIAVVPHRQPSVDNSTQLFAVIAVAAVFRTNVMLLCLQQKWHD